MYDEFYQFHLLPFEGSPDPRFFFASEQHREALAAIEYTVRMRRSFALITGEIGAGKTVVSRTLCHRLGDTAQIVPIHPGQYHAVNVVRQTLQKIDPPVSRDDDRPILLDRLRDYLSSRLSDPRPLVLLVDEAQTLCDQAFEELRLISNMESWCQKPAQIVLIGQPQLRARFANASMAALRQRITMAKHLRRLDRDEVGQYIEHRLRVATRPGVEPRVKFHEHAVEAIDAYSAGIPRVINMVCDNCLLVGHVVKANVIDANMVDTVLSEMLPVLDTPTSYRMPDGAARGDGMDRTDSLGIAA